MRRYIKKPIRKQNAFDCVLDGIVFVLLFTLLFSMLLIQGAHDLVPVEAEETPRPEFIKAAAPAIKTVCFPVSEAGAIDQFREFTEKLTYGVSYGVPFDHDFQTFIVELCEEYHIDPAVVFAVIETESNYKADVMGDNGHAYGLMQVQQRFHRERMERLAVSDLLDPYQNVIVGVDYLAELVNEYDGNVEMALVAYNAGPVGAENGWFSHGVYSSDYSRKVLTAAQHLAEGVTTYVYSR